MRYVEIVDGLKPDEKWLTKSEQLLQQLRDAKTNDERQKIIDKNSAHWRDPAFKQWLMGLFHNKCWYTEATGDASSMHVDHFRPKGRVRDGDRELEGYWWLAFDWENYRICGDLINVKKRDEFPVQGEFRASVNDSRVGIEDADLLDPRKQGDVALISYEADGRAIAASGIAERDRFRVGQTLRILGLNKRQTIIDGRKKIWSDCLDYVAKFNNAVKSPRPLDEIQRASAITELRKKVVEKEPYSMVAATCVRKTGSEALVGQVFS